MNDRSRYRAWNPYEKKMIYYDLNQLISAIWSENPKDSLSDLSKLWDSDRTDSQKLQCTGLKDKNGRLIYEGDIVLENMWFHQKGPEIVLRAYAINGKTGEPMKDAAPIEYPWFNFKLVDGKYQYVSLEIIGNIYENPELTSQT
jgi:hypothetical protein